MTWFGTASVDLVSCAVLFDTEVMILLIIVQTPLLYRLLIYNVPNVLMLSERFANKPL